MKKIIIAASLVAVALTSNAQDTYKFAAGDNNLELNFTPLGGSPFGIGNIKYRRFLSESTALRLGVGITYSSNKDAVDINDPASATVPPAKIELNETQTSFGWNIRPGFEKHFAGTERLSPYIGAELDIAGQSYTEKVERYNAIDKKVETNTTKGDVNGDKSFFRAGVNLVAGFDYYFAKRLYAGAEMGFGFQTIMKSEVKISDSQTGFVTPAAERVGSTMNLAPTVNAAIRVGFLF